MKLLTYFRLAYMAYIMLHYFRNFLFPIELYLCYTKTNMYIKREDERA